MQIEIKCALEFLLSYLYDKLPRRRVNLFGDELEKYLKLKLMTSDSKICLNINYKQNNMELIDPCLIAASKESAMDLKEILECWPIRLKLFIGNGMVTYSLDQDLNIQEDSTQSEQVKVIYNEKTDSFLLPTSPQNIASPQATVPDNQLFDMFQMNKSNKIENNIQPQQFQQQQQHQNRRPFKNNNKIFNNQPNHLNLSPNNNNNKSRGLNLNFNNVKSPNNMYNSPGNPWSFNNTPVGATSPYQQVQDFLSLSSSSSSASASSSSSHLSNPPEDFNSNQIVTSPSNNGLVPNVKTPTGSNVSMFTTAAFAQTKFGSTKSKNNYTRQSKQHKMLPNEFSAYIRNKVKMLNGNCNANLNKIDNNMNMNGDNYVDYAFLGDQIPSISLSSYSSAISPQLQAPPNFFKNGAQNNNQNSYSFDPTNNLMRNFKYNQNGGTTPIEGLNVSSSQLFQPELLLTNSSMNELDDNLISNYFSSTFSSPSSSTTSSSSSSSSSTNTESSNNHAINDMMNSNNNLLNQINNLTI